jgi:quinol-cytochrome oxidoreductase complex cytochrome b subunit
VKANPLRTPGVLRPSWPLLAWYSAVDRAPSWLPVPLFLVLALVALVFWPNVAGRLAEKKPALHTACGIAAIAALLALVALEVMR